jgi:hypothetical protein
MNKIEFVATLRATASELQPLTKAITPGGAIWNGATYVKHTGPEIKPDPTALAWWSVLTAIAELLEAQDTPLSTKQLSYLDRLLFGGMGSLNDLWFDPETAGNRAHVINEALNEKRRALFEVFRGPTSRDEK